MSQFFDIAKNLSRTAAKMAVDPLAGPKWQFPPLNDEEKQWIEILTGGHELSNEEAHILLKSAKIEAAVARWLESRKP